MTPRELTDRLLRSRQMYWGFKSPWGAMRGGPAMELAVVRTEIGILRDLALSHPDRSKKIHAIVRLWEQLAVGIGSKLIN